MATSGPPGKGTLALALLASLLLHAGVGLVLVLVPGPGAVGAAAGGLQVDSCTVEAEEGGGTFLVAGSDAGPMQAVLILPVVLSEPANPKATLLETPVLVAASPGLPPTPALPGNPLRDAQGADAPRSEAIPPPSGTASHGIGKSSDTAKFFDVEAQGQTFVYVIDRSSSMGPNGGLRAAREQLLASLQELPSTARFQVIVYNRSAEPLVPDRPYWMEATPENIQHVASRLGSLLAEGGTDHLPALRRALALQPDVLFFLTDADDLTAELLRAVARLNVGRHSVIHAIELNTLHRDLPDMPMHVLALENRGTYRAVDLQGQE